jgi:hypothetical protein
MESKKQLITQLKKLRNSAFNQNLLKVIFLSVFVILAPISIYSKIQESDILTVIVLLIAETFFIGIIIILLKSGIMNKNIHNSSIYQSIEDPGLVTEIIVTTEKIVFEIKGLEDETLFIKESTFRTEMLKNIKDVFGENKVVLK